MNESLTLQPLCVLATTTGTDLGVLAGILDASSDACWCMEFTGPVDLTAPDHEVVRQVFLNDPRWRFCNAAMARLYLLPPDRVFDDQPVSDIFPRNRQNEEFVLNLISNGFEVDAAPALDRRYDGVQIYVENDVRAHIEDGRLIRMFGVVRDVGKHRHREEALKAERDVALAMLAAQPIGRLPRSVAIDSDTVTRQLSCLPVWPQYCRATPTECFPFFGNPVSSKIQCTASSGAISSGSTRLATADSIASSLHGASANR